MPRRRAAPFAVLLAILAIRAAGGQTIGPHDLTDEHVRSAIEAIVDELYARRDPATHWEPGAVPGGESNQRGGYTALTVLALLTAGERYQDPRLRDAIRYLENLATDGTYAVSVRAMVWAGLPPRFRPALDADAGWLLEGFSERAGGWNYRQQPNTTRRDNSITQYGALALWEASRRGVRIDPRYWATLESRFVEMQLADGGWNYVGDGPASGSMTTAGLATLFITQDQLHADDDPDAPPRPYETALERGLDWMDANFSPTDNPGTFRDYYYYLYGVERVGLAGGRKFFGERDWFREGAAELIRRLCRWDPETKTMHVLERVGGDPRSGEVRVRHLTFALMFLGRGRVPVCVNKLRVDGWEWNRRPRDAANLAQWITETTEKKVNWQIVDLDSDPEDWLDAPLLYVSSRAPVPWLEGRDDAALARLGRYLELGGTLLAVAEAGDRGFAQSIERTGRRLRPELSWADLPRDHWAFSIVHPVEAAPLRGLSNGVRELIVLVPSGAWPGALQLGNERARDVFATATNLYLYASEKNRPRPRLDRHAPPTPVADEGAGAITVVRASYDGAWNPEPAAIPLLRATDPALARMRVEDHPLAELDALDPPPALVVVSGTDTHTFTESERQAVRAYAESGGVILFETTGGRGAFALESERMAVELFGRPVRSVLRRRVITGEDVPGATSLARVEYRPYSFEVFGGRETTPRLRGMRIGDDVRLLFSREDISHALLGQPCWGVNGYTTPFARRLMHNIIEYAAAPSAATTP